MSRNSCWRSTRRIWANEIRRLGKVVKYQEESQDGRDPEKDTVAIEEIHVRSDKANGE